MTFFKKLSIWTLKGFAFIFLALIIISAIIITFEIKVELSQLNKPVEIAAEKALNREVSMRGDVILVPTLWPTLEINQVTIGNPRDDEDKSNMAEFGQLRLQLGLLPILSGEIHVAEISARQVTFKFKTDKDGQPNWQFKTEDKKSDDGAAQQSPATVTDINSPQLQFEALDKIVFEDINIHYEDKVINKSFHFNLEKLAGSAAQNKDITFKFNGHFQKKNFSGEVMGGGLNSFRNSNDEWPLNMTLNISGVDIKLSGRLLRGSDRRLSSTLTIGETDIAAILEWLEIMKGARIGSKSLNITTELRGDSLSDLLTQSELTITLKDAWWTLTDKNTAAQIPIKIHKGVIAIDKTYPVHIDLLGALDQTNININIKGAPIIDYFKSDKQLPLEMKINALATDLTLKTQHPKNVSVENLNFDMMLAGNQLNDLNTLFKTDFPPIGPYHLQGKFAVTPGGYTIKQFRVGVKDSHLNGNLNFNTQVKPPKLNLALNSPAIQINNFDVGEWSPEKSSEKNVLSLKKDIPDEKQKNDQRPGKLLSYDTLSRIDASIDIAVQQVLSGPDKLGNGALTINLDNARFNLLLKNLSLPGGNANANFVYHPSGNKTLDITLQMQVTSFDYGIMARRIDPQSNVAGLVSLDIDLASHEAKNIDSLLINSQGHLNFSWSPEALNADLFELWVINLMSALLNKADNDNTSKVNCVVGKFDFDQGMMKERLIFADTTKMRLIGEAQANFHDRTITVKVAPQAKRPEFFSLATPVGLKGQFDDFRMRINPIGLTKTVVTFITSPAHVPVRRLITKNLPEDGNEACQQMWEEPPEE